MPACAGMTTQGNCHVECSLPFIISRRAPGHETLRGENILPVNPESFRGQIAHRAEFFQFEAAVGVGGLNSVPLVVIAGGIPGRWCIAGRVGF